MKLTPPGPGLARAQIARRATIPISMMPRTSSTLPEIVMPRYWRRATAVITTIINTIVNQGQLMPQFACSSCCRHLFGDLDQDNAKHEGDYEGYGIGKGGRDPCKTDKEGGKE